MKINEKLNKKNIITAYNATDYSITQTSAYVRIPLTGSINVGEQFTIENNQIKIGKGISKIKASANVGLPSNSISTGSKNLVIRKNGVIMFRAWLSINPVINTAITIAPKLIEVEENDLIDIAFYGASGDTIVGGPAFSDITLESVN